MDSLNSEEYLVVLFFISIIKTPLIDYIEQFFRNLIIGALLGCLNIPNKIINRPELFKRIINFLILIKIA